MTGRSASPAAHTERVRALFDGEAASWLGKYAPEGRLAGRLSQLTTAVGDHVAAGAQLLDLSCGIGELVRDLAVSGFQVTGCDIAPQMLRRAAAADPDAKVSWLRLAPRRDMLPFGPSSANAVAAASVLEYVPDPYAVLSECARMLRPGGVLLCTVPNPADPVRWLEWLTDLTARGTSRRRCVQRFAQAPAIPELPAGFPAKTSGRLVVRGRPERRSCRPRVYSAAVAAGPADSSDPRTLGSARDSCGNY